MDETFLPWWLVLLLGMWAVSLTLWQQGQVPPEVRLWAGLFSLVYTLLIFVALSRSQDQSNTTSPHVPWVSLLGGGAVICVAVSLICATLMLGPISNSSRRLCYFLLTLANASYCLLIHAYESAACLFLVSFTPAWALLREYRQQTKSTQKRFSSGFIQQTRQLSLPEERGKSWLSGSLNIVMALVLIGTLAYATRVEILRATASRRASALPSHKDLIRLNSNNDHPPAISVADLVSGVRSDVIVLIAVIVFLSLASTQHGQSPSSKSGPKSRVTITESGD